MIVANYSAVRNNLKHYCDLVYEKGETLIITRKEDKNVVLMSLERYTEFEQLLLKASTGKNKSAE